MKKMARDSTSTQLNFDCTEPAGWAHPSSFSTSAVSPRPAVPTKVAVNDSEKKRKWPGDNEGYGGHDQVQRQVPKIFASKLQKSRAPTQGGNGNRPQGTVAVAAKISAVDKASIKWPEDVSAPRAPPARSPWPPLAVRNESPWKSHEKGYETELGGSVTVAKRKHPASGLVVVKELSGPSAENQLSMLRHISAETQGAHFLSCLAVCRFEQIFHIISECMATSLTQIVAVPQYPREHEVAAIIGQVI